VRGCPFCQHCQVGDSGWRTTKINQWLINVEKLTSFSSIWLHRVTLTVYERSCDLRLVLLSWLSRLEKEELKVETVQTCHRVSNLLHDDELAPRSLGFHQGGGKARTASLYLFINMIYIDLEWFIFNFCENPVRSQSCFQILRSRAVEKEVWCSRNSLVIFLYESRSKWLKNVEDHFSIAGEMCRKHCKAICPPQKKDTR
jgi:hypothetical protein